MEEDINCWYIDPVYFKGSEDRGNIQFPGERKIHYLP